MTRKRPGPFFGPRKGKPTTQNLSHTMFHSPRFYIKINTINYQCEPAGHVSHLQQVLLKPEISLKLSILLGLWL